MTVIAASQSAGGFGVGNSRLQYYFHTQYGRQCRSSGFAGETRCQRRAGPVDSRTLCIDALRPDEVNAEKYEY